MKRIIPAIIFLLLCTQVSWAKREKIDTISRNPYVSALVIDADTGKVLFSEQSDVPVYPASVLKLMDLLVILETIDSGQLRLDDMVQVTTEAAKTGGSQVYLDPKEQFSVEELLYALMVQSANDAAVALAIHVAGSKEGFVELMNRKAAELGMKSTTFHSVHGLPPSKGQKPDVTTANDLALLCRALVARPDSLVYTGTYNRGFRNDTFMMRNHNPLLKSVDGCDGLKTGYYQVAGFSIAATAKRKGVRIIAIVLGSQDRKVRDATAAGLLAKGFSMVPPRLEKEIKTTPIGSDKPVARPVAQTTGQEDTPVSEEFADAPAEKEKTATDSFTGRDLKMFLLGMGAGLLLSLIPTFLILRRKPVKKNRPHDSLLVS